MKPSGCSFEGFFWGNGPLKPLNPPYPPSPKSALKGIAADPKLILGIDQLQPLHETSLSE